MIMKRLFLVVARVAAAISGMAQSHEIGVIVGGINGLSHKYWFSEDLAVQTDLAVGLTAAPMGVYFKGNKLAEGTNSQYDFTINPNLLYHFDLAESLQLYAGAGINFGLMSDINNTNPDFISGKFGVNGSLGLAYNLHPVVLAFDFRPGYGLGFTEDKNPHVSFFDWKLSFAVRYCL